MTFKRRPSVYDQRERRLKMETALRTTTCSKGHTHPPWNTTGILRVEKCESICGFCQKETKTAANLRKHVAIHIKNERLNLTIAEGSSGRGRLEMPHSFERETSSSSSRISHISDDLESSPSIKESSLVPRQRSSHSATSTDPFSPSAVLMSMHQPHSHTGTPRASYYSSTSSNPYPVTTSAMSSYSYPACSTPATSHISSHNHSHNPYPSQTEALYPYSEKDLFRGLREHNISTKSAWTVMPASEGTRVVEMCKSLSVAQVVESSGHGSRALTQRAPCYNRETLYDEEWQAHMRDVHGVFFLWPDTWMRRIEVVDLEPYGGDIGCINNMVMEG